MRWQGRWGGNRGKPWRGRMWKPGELVAATAMAKNDGGGDGGGGMAVADRGQGWWWSAKGGDGAACGL